MLDRSYPAPKDAGSNPSYPLDHYSPAPHQLGYGIHEEKNGFTPLHFLRYAVKYRWVIAITCIVGVALGVVVTMMQPQLYQSTARLEIMAPSARIIQEMELVSQTSDLRSFLTAREKLRSRATVMRVVHELGLAERADFLFPAPSFSLRNIINRAFGIGNSENLDKYLPEQREEIAIGRVMSNLQVELVHNTSLLAVSYSDQNAKVAAEIANQIAQSYIDQRVDQSSQTSDLTRRFIEDQVEQVKAKLQRSEEELVAYAKSQSLTLSIDQKSLISSNIEAINTALSKTIEERLNNQLLVQQIDAGRAASLDQVLSSEGLQKLNAEIARLSAEYQQKLSAFKPAFPEMRQLEAQINELRRQYKDGIIIVTEGARMRYQESVAREADLRKKLAELEEEHIRFQDKNIRYTILKREVDSNRSQYETLIGKLNDVGVSADLRSNNAELADFARIAGAPYTPRLSINLAIALALSVAFFTIIIYLLELLNNRFANPDQIEKELGVALLGILPKVNGAQFTQELVDPKSGLSEAYRTLRTALQFSGPEGAPKTLVVTSSEPNEGKSTTAMKLAQDFAALGQRVAIVDADLRKPNLHRLFGITNTLGLSNILTNTVPAEQSEKILRRVGDQNVWVITSGTIPPNPADLLSSPRMALILQQLSQRFDIVIIDSPPVVGLADAPLLGRLAEATLFVVSYDQITRKAGAVAIKRLRAAGAEIIGATMSKFSVNKLDYTDAYRHMNYSYYGYGTENELLPISKNEETQTDGPTRRIHQIGKRIRTIIRRLSDRLNPVG